MTMRSNLVDRIRRLSISSAFLLVALLTGVSLIGTFKLNIGFIFLNKAVSGEKSLLAANATEFGKHYLFDASNVRTTARAAQRAIGFIEWQEGNRDAAIAHWREAQLPAEQLIHWGDEAKTLHKDEKAIVWYEAAINLDAALASESLANQYHEMQEYERAIDVWQNALAKYPSSDQRLIWWHGLVRSMQAKKDWKQATEVLEMALVEFPDNPALLTALASTLLSQSAPFEPIYDTLQKAINIDDSYAEAYVVLARLSSREEHYQAAYSYFDLAIELDSSVKWWHVARADALRRSGNLSGAISLFQETIDRFPAYAPAYYELAWVCKVANRPAEAQTAIQKAINLHNSPPPNYYILAGDIYAWNNQLGKARSAYQLAAELAPNDKRIIQGLEALNRKR